MVNSGLHIFFLSNLQIIEYLLQKLSFQIFKPLPSDFNQHPLPQIWEKHI